MFFLSYIRKKISNNHGFSLIELLTSLVIFTIVVSTMYGFFVQASSNTKMSQNKTVGVNLARNALVYLQKKEFMDFYEFRNQAGELIQRPYTMGYCFDIDTQCNDESANFINGDDFFKTVFATGEADTTEAVWDKVFQPEINRIPYKLKVTFGKIAHSDSEGESEAGRYLDSKIGETDAEFEQRKKEMANKLDELIIPLEVEVAWQDSQGRMQRTSVEGYLRNGKAYVDDE